ncbi:MAG: protocatechuate 3,4-dioxygenase subunit beta [Segniliparus sp.]|uniref:protocatechuate 3,4-dioxygenase subunit beta n=1 Tax=Segniliparus sp. TaxID=2804064 RepID=UPI003F330191
MTAAHSAARPGGAPASQDQIDAEIAHHARQYIARGRRDLATAINYPPYRSSVLRHPTKDPIGVDPEQVELHSPVFGHQDVHPLEADLTIAGTGAPIGERITVSGRVLDVVGRPVRGQLVEVWQANAAGRYAHRRDQHQAPLDPNFLGVGRVLTDVEGWYSFTTIKPGAYPWRNHHNAWRPAHIHFSLFGTAFTQRLITQMYFPGDPLFAFDPIYRAIPDEAARAALVASYDHSLSQPETSLGYRWDIVLSGSRPTPTEDGI